MPVLAVVSWYLVSRRCEMIGCFGYFMCLNSWLRKEEEQFTNYVGFFLPDEVSVVFLVLIKDSQNRIAPCLVKQRERLVYLEVLGSHQNF